MEYIEVCNDVRLSRVVQGFWRLLKWEFTVSDLVKFMEQCVDLGVTTFDTAEVYGNTLVEQMMGEAFKKAPYLKDKVQIVSKTGIVLDNTDGKIFNYYDTRYSSIINSCKGSLQRLNRDYLDVYLIHREDPCIDHFEAARALQDLIKEGLIKCAGVSNFDPFKFDALNTAMGGTLVTNQIEVSPVCFEHFNSGMIDMLGKLKVHPMVWSPLAGGRLFTSYEEIYAKARTKMEEIAERYNKSPDTIVYAWLLYHPVKAIPISGSKDINRLKNAVEALEIKLTHKEWFEIYKASGQQVLK